MQLRHRIEGDSPVGTTSFCYVLQFTLHQSCCFKSFMCLCSCPVRSAIRGSFGLQA
uniref:Uncharacterized protein n=1 Tax=Anguilla anguilla TaxID=7936 RepID=A0A0E9QN72_ANGAN